MRNDHPFPTQVGCAYPDYSPEALQKALAGRTVVFAGDSTVRLMFLNFLQIALRIGITECPGSAQAASRCLCHGFFEVRLDARVWPYGNQRIECHPHLKDATTIKRVKDEHEILLLFLTTPLLDCKVLNFDDFGGHFSMKSCLDSSGDYEDQKRFLTHVLPRADVALFSIGIHIVGRLGVIGCIESAEFWFPQLADLSANATLRFLMGSTPPSPVKQPEKISLPTAKEPYPHRETNARVAACNDYQGDFARRSRGKWTYLGQILEMAFIAQEFAMSPPHFLGMPNLDILARALCGKFAPL